MSFIQSDLYRRFHCITCFISITLLYSMIRIHMSSSSPPSHPHTLTPSQGTPQVSRRSCSPFSPAPVPIISHIPSYTKTHPTTTRYIGSPFHSSDLVPFHPSPFQSTVKCQAYTVIVQYETNVTVPIPFRPPSGSGSRKCCQ